MPLATIATALRFFATNKAGRKPGNEDWFALIALVCMLICTSMQLYGKRAPSGQTQ
jgi:hypothetical protein